MPLDSSFELWHARSRRLSESQRVNRYNCQKGLAPVGGVFLGILGGGVPPDSSNLDPNLDQKM